MIKSLNNSLQSLHKNLHSISVRRVEKKANLDAIAQNITGKLQSSEIKPMRLSSPNGQGSSGLMGRINSIMAERVQAVSDLIAQGIDPTAAKYAVAGEMASKGAAALKDYKEQQEKEVVDDGTREDEQSVESSEVVEEVETNPSTGERVTKIKIVKKISGKNAQTSGADVDVTTQAASTGKGSRVNLKV